jgi:hypothetical protein
MPVIIGVDRCLKGVYGQCQAFLAQILINQWNEVDPRLARTAAECDPAALNRQPRQP